MYIVLLAKEIAITSINITSDFMLVCRRFKSECETSPIRQEILYHFSFSLHYYADFNLLTDGLDWRAQKVQLVDIQITRVSTKNCLYKKNDHDLQKYDLQMSFN